MKLDGAEQNWTGVDEIGLDTTEWTGLQGLDWTGLHVSGLVLDLSGQHCTSLDCLSLTTLHCTSPD